MESNKVYIQCPECGGILMPSLTRGHYYCHGCGGRLWSEAQIRERCGI